MSNKYSRYWNLGKGGNVYWSKTKKGEIRWAMQFKDPVRGWIQKTIPYAQTKQEALLALEKKKREIFEQVNGIKPQVKRIRFQEFAAIYLDDYARPRKKSWKTDEGTLKPLRRFFGNRFLDEIDSHRLEQYVKFRLGNYHVSTSTVNYDLAVLKKMLNLAIEWRYLEASAKPKIRMFPETPPRDRTLSLEEQVRLLKECCPHVRDMVILALNTGMRRGEIFHLRWDQVDFDSRTIIVKRTKNNRNRPIPMNDVVLGRLRMLNNGSEYVFVNRATGKPFTDIGRAFDAACRRADIKGLHFHDLRHTFGTRLAKFAPPSEIQMLLGHSSLEVTQRYIHLLQGSVKEAVEKLDDRGSLLGIYDQRGCKREKMPLNGLFNWN